MRHSLHRVIGMAIGALLTVTALPGVSAVQAAAPPPDAVQVCPDAAPGVATCLAMRRTDIAARPATAVTPAALPGGFGPADLASAYALPSGLGAGMTVAVVDAYDLPTAEQDLAVYRSTYGLSPCTTLNGCFRKVDQRGGTAYPPADAGWGQEIALDLDMVSAVCPACHILLVEADNAEMANLGAAVNTAVALGAVAVSNSYGTPEDYTVTSLDAYYNHPGVAITAASGDCGWNCTPVEGGLTQHPYYPATSPYVISVGGTRLVRDSGTARGWSETAWTKTGSGCSQYEQKPSWQHDPSCSNRTSSDVAAVADPNTGVAVYNSALGAGVWSVFGGTSASAPIIAALYGLAGAPPTDYPARLLYAFQARLNDVVGGNNDSTWGTCPGGYICNAVAGYDGPTGLGTPSGIQGFSPTSATYHPLAPARILDSRTGTGLSGAFSSHVARTFTVWGAGGVPAGATAVTGNLTVTAQTSRGFLYAGPVPVDNPTSSTLNFPAGDDRANAVTVALSSAGTLSITYAAPTYGPSAQVIFDVTGFFSPDASGVTYQPLTPARILDTRASIGIAGALGSHVAQSFAVRGVGGVPAGATAVTGNLTVTAQQSLGFLYIGPQQADNPTSSTLNFPAGDDRANAVTVALSTDGRLWVTYAAPTLGPSAQVIFDVTGYFAPGPGGSAYVPLNPTRILDTRNGTGGLGALSSHTAAGFGVWGAGGVPAGSVAVSGNLTVTGQTSLGFLYVGPAPANNPTSSTLNFPMGDDRANAVTVALSPDGHLYVTYAAPIYGPITHAIFDVTGYFAPVPR
jgi:hypothetical protein